MTYSKLKCVGRITVFLAICLVGSILVSAPFITLLFNGNSNTFLAKSAPDIMALAGSAFLLIALTVENRIEKLDLWAFWRTALQTETVLVSILLGLLWQLFIYLICQLSDAAYPHPNAISISSLLISILSTGLIVPFTEEMLFRKWLADMMERGHFKSATIIIFSSVLFFCIHLGDPFFRADTLIFAIPLCYIYIKYHDIRYCVIAHAVCNLAGIAIPLLVH